MNKPQSVIRLIDLCRHSSILYSSRDMYLSLEGGLKSCQDFLGLGQVLSLNVHERNFIRDEIADLLPTKAEWSDFLEEIIISDYDCEISLIWSYYLIESIKGTLWYQGLLWKAKEEFLKFKRNNKDIEEWSGIISGATIPIANTSSLKKIVEFLQSSLDI